ncbi:ABC transporter ATP-binding protein [Phaeovulum vinaykumarii]|uniref:Putative ABC transport system ATP-binding protein n=1 Tax=Phaeovulum vinaykumarii TaxID=407234 RepID=A0A1N7KUI1_9RHOB|nr:ABC transporter ATP-binding protein [Phaeovulum vinaykumarii]SIS65258.1 putative ABC transport system ATP-binding protein [Phaeovulum vinaykumarii]SOC01347.1 putative ABC transport system ATP-binding protein [Phaeovulum vinaykumarii]
MPDPALSLRPAFSLRGVTRVYGEGRSAVQALRGVDLDIPAGEIVVMLGASGSGKSTLLNILGGLDRPSAGSVRFQGTELTGLSDAALTRYRRDHVGFVFQFYNLMPGLTARENVELVTEIARAPMPAAEALALVGLGARADHFPAQLSGGEQQRVAIARAIAKQPEVLFCDEPTGALDSATGRAVLEVLCDVNARLGATVLMVTHAASIAGLAHRVVRLSDGQIADMRENATRLSPAEVVW